ncbi:MAG: PKD domain-containing protein [Bacteroidetes bacterium]|nr:PKD domain-containing protein [Bacteroidota bacterium]
MKTLKTLSLLIALVCCSYWSNAQFLCGISQVYFYETTNPNQTFTFHDTTQLQPNWQIVSWHWDFGDGTTSTLQSPQHHYSNNGVYTVCEVVSAYSNGVACSDTFCKVITVSCTSITGNFTYAAGALGLVSFTSAFTSTYTPITYTWNFGDGSSGTGAGPTHTYNIPGVYTVCVTATDANGCSKTVCNQIGITSGICGSLSAAFNATTNGNVVRN